MKVWHFSETPYPDAWGDSSATESLRVTLPNGRIDPRGAASLLNRYMDEYVLCDELGMNIMLNEHHSTATCLSASCTIPLAMLARQTKRARLLVLGIPIGNRPDPVRVAEEIAYIDLISNGRVELGLVKGAPHEITPANANPARVMDRFWEAHDLVLKALSSHDGPFNWEGEYYHYRHVNIWPRCYQDPHPPVWATVGTEPGSIDAAKRGFNIATLLSGLNARTVFQAYRRQASSMGLDEATILNKLGYLALVGVGRTEAEGMERLEKIAGFLRTVARTSPQFSNPPGYSPVSANVFALRQKKRGALGAHYNIQTKDGKPLDPTTASLTDLINAGVCFGGTPDQVVHQIESFNNYVGGMGHLLAMMQGGRLTHRETVANLTLFSREVLPRLTTMKVGEHAPYLSVPMMPFGGA